MKIAHISDLHIGFSLHGVNINTFQTNTLSNIVKDLVKNDISHLLLAGDIFDKSVMSQEATQVYDLFINELYENDIKVYMISGNHDSYQKLSLYKNLLSSMDVFISKRFIEFFEIDEKTRLYTIPYISHYDLKNEVEGLKSYNDAYEYLLNSILLDKSKTNLLMLHAFVNGSKITETSESEKALSVGGLDQVSSKLFEEFDYVALGHIHKPQKISDNIYYSGSILPYSFSEKNDQKQILVFDTETKEVSNIPIYSQYKLIELRGCFYDMLEEAPIEDAFYKIILTDKTEVISPYQRLNDHFKNVLVLEQTSLEMQNIEEYQLNKKLTPLEQFDSFVSLFDEEIEIDKPYIINVIDKSLEEDE